MKAKRPSYISALTPLGRITRDVVCCFFVVLCIVRTQQSKTFQHYRRTTFGTGQLNYNRYILNVTVNNMKYRSILGEITGAALHRSSEAVILLASGQKGADACRGGQIPSCMPEFAFCMWI